MLHRRKHSMNMCTLHIRTCLSRYVFLLWLTVNSQWSFFVVIYKGNRLVSANIHVNKWMYVAWWTLTICYTKCQLLIWYYHLCEDTCMHVWYGTLVHIRVFVSVCACVSACLLHPCVCVLCVCVCAMHKTYA